MARVADENTLPVMVVDAMQIVKHKSMARDDDEVLILEARPLTREPLAKPKRICQIAGLLLRLSMARNPLSRRTSISNPDGTPRIARCPVARLSSAAALSGSVRSRYARAAGPQ